VSGLLVTGIWGHLALIGFWAVIFGATLLAARRWIGGPPQEPAWTHQHGHLRPPHLVPGPTMDSRHRQRG
jgi:hypothetical protein